MLKFAVSRGLRNTNVTVYRAIPQSRQEALYSIPLRSSQCSSATSIPSRDQNMVGRSA